MKLSHIIIGSLWLTFTVAIAITTYSNPEQSSPVVVTGIESGISPPEHSKSVHTEGGIPGAWIQATRTVDGKTYEFYVNPFKAKQFHMNDTIRVEKCAGVPLGTAIGIFIGVTLLTLMCFI